MANMSLLDVFGLLLVFAALFLRIIILERRLSKLWDWVDRIDTVTADAPPGAVLNDILKRLEALERQRL